MKPKLNAAFWKWFGKSVVKNEDGTPKVVYHGGSSRIRNVFDIDRCELGCHFGTKDQAKEFTPNDIGVDEAVERGLIGGFYLSIKRPLRLPDMNSWRAEDGQIFDALAEAGFDLDDIPALSAGKEDKELRSYLLSLGYDGIVYLNRREGGAYVSDRELRAGAKRLGIDSVGSYESVSLRLSDDDFKKISKRAEDSYIAFHPEQIKSIDNDGTWDADDPDIRSNPAVSDVIVTRVWHSDDRAFKFQRIATGTYQGRPWMAVEVPITEASGAGSGVVFMLRSEDRYNFSPQERRLIGRAIKKAAPDNSDYDSGDPSIGNNPPVRPDSIPIALKRAADRVASTLADEQSENYRSLDFCEPIAQRAWELFAELGIDAPVTRDGSHHFNEVTFLGKTYTVDFWERAYDDQGEPVPDEESGSGYLCAIKRPPEIRLKLTSSNPDRVYSLKHVIEHLHRTDGTGDPDWLKYLESLVAPFKKWEIAYVDPSEIDSECGDQETAEEYASDFDSLPPVVLIPSDTGGDRFEVVDGSHRICAASILEVTIQAYIPVGTRNGDA